jgi:hypothetical protein
MTDGPPRPTDSPPKPLHEAETVTPQSGPSAVGPGGPSREPSSITALLRSGKDPADLPIQIGRYRLERLLGRGGMGAVFLAYDTQLDRHVALKVPSFGHDDGELRERFLREARAAATLRHPNLCPVYDIGEQDGVYYLTMAFIDGKPLSDFLPADKPFPAREAAELVRVLALALQEAHEHGIIHRDLKPANILIGPKKEPIITDFGLARRVASADQRLTHSGTVVGTPAYMPPEQVNGDVAAMGPCCDVYSLGVILYELLANRPPFEGPLGVLMAQIVLDPPTPPSKYRPGLDPALEAICLKALAKKPQDRFPSMLAFAHALEQWLAGQPAPVAVTVGRAIPVAALPEALPVAEIVTASPSRRRTATARRAPTRPVREPRSRAGMWVLVVCGSIFLLCVLPVGGLVLLIRQTVGEITDKAGQFTHQFEDAQKEQTRRRDDRKREQQQLERIARAWQPPPEDAGRDRLFPAAVGGFERVESDDRADVADLNLTHAGRRAVYRGEAGTVELFAYRATRLEKEALLDHAQKALLRRGVVAGMPGFVPGGADLRGSPDGAYMSYDLGSAAGGAGRCGTFWWHRDWLFLARGSDPDLPGLFLQGYLALVGKPRGPRGKP